ncbi:MAG TPA: hypothetical protein VES62_07420 [Thermoleophilaceae bacterium]|nr:hypothetical protein [Thermoleophilaceae bacterium]
MITLVVKEAFNQAATRGAGGLLGGLPSLYLMREHLKEQIPDGCQEFFVASSFWDSIAWNCGLFDPRIGEISLIPAYLIGIVGALAGLAAAEMIRHYKPSIRSQQPPAPTPPASPL